MELEKEIITPPGGPPALPVLSHATKFGNLVFVSGQLGPNPQTREYEPDIRVQTRQLLERLKVILEAAGTSLDQVLSNSCYITDQEDFVAFNEVYREYFPDNPPARTTVGVTLMAAGALVEITAVAGIPH